MNFLVTLLLWLLCGAWIPAPWRLWILVFTAVLALLWGGARRSGDLTLLFVSLFILLWVPAVKSGPLAAALPEMPAWREVMLSARNTLRVKWRAPRHFSFSCSAQ